MVGCQKKHLVLFDVDRGCEDYLSYKEKVKESERLGIDVVPLLFHGKVSDHKQLHELLQKESFLGGNKVEGIVVKNYNRFGQNGKILIGKHVSEEYKETQKKDWKKQNPGQRDIINIISDMLKTKARWEKAIQHIRDEGGFPEYYKNKLMEKQFDEKERKNEEGEEIQSG